ncbi:hypothetical protein ID866_9748 [Astraeus odoratus]|nr:hypothetical protein ID866_9748 [Astraeus odoratus]
MSTSNQNVMPINWQEVPDKELGWDEADPEDIAMAKLQQKFWCKQVWEAEEAKRCREAEEVEKGVHEAEEAWHWKVAEAERQREAEKEPKKWQHTKSKAGPNGSQGQKVKCMQCVKASVVCIVGPGTKWKVACDQCSHNKENLRKEWMQKDEAALSKHLKGKDKDKGLSKEKEQEGNEGSKDEGEEGEAE